MCLWASESWFCDADSWTWFCGGSKAPTGEGKIYNCTACISTLTGPFSSACVQHAIICFGQLLLLVIFFTLLVISKSFPPGALSGAELLSTFEVGSVLYNVTSVLSGLVGLANAALGVYRFFSVPAIAAHVEIYLVVQGVAWITIAISLRIRYMIKTLVIESKPCSLSFNNPKVPFHFITLK